MARDLQRRPRVENETRHNGKVSAPYLADFGGKITINVPLFKKLRDIIFFAGQSLYEPFQGTF